MPACERHRSRTRGPDELREFQTRHRAWQTERQRVAQSLDHEASISFPKAFALYPILDHVSPLEFDLRASLQGELYT